MMRPWHLCIGFLWTAVILSPLPEARQQPFVRAQRERFVVEFGRSVVINCSTNCQYPVRGVLETSLEKEDAGEGRGWKAFRLLNVSHWADTLMCHFECTDATDMEPQRVNFTVYQPPKLVKLDLVPVIEVGENYTLTCRVFNVAPIRNLSVIFLKGRKILHTQTFEKRAEREPDDVEVNHTVTAQQGVYGEGIGCRAVLNLWPDGPVYGKASVDQTLNIMDYTGIIVATVSTAMLVVILVAIGIYACSLRKQ